VRRTARPRNSTLLSEPIRATRIALERKPISFKRVGYVVMSRLGAAGVGGDGEIAKVSHTFQPSGR
jgi:hypothetical protein